MTKGRNIPIQITTGLNKLDLSSCSVQYRNRCPPYVTVSSAKSVHHLFLHACIGEKRSEYLVGQRGPPSLFPIPLSSIACNVLFFWYEYQRDSQSGRSVQTYQRGRIAPQKVTRPPTVLSLFSRAKFGSVYNHPQQAKHTTFQRPIVLMLISYQPTSARRYLPTAPS